MIRMSGGLRSIAWRSRCGVSPVRRPTQISAPPMPAAARAGCARRRRRGPSAARRRRCRTPEPSRSGSRARRSIPHRNAVSVLPEPVGAQISVFAPEAIAGQPSVWAGVGASNEASNQRRTGARERRRGGDSRRSVSRPCGQTVDVTPAAGEARGSAILQAGNASPPRRSGRRRSATAEAVRRGNVIEVAGTTAAGEVEAMARRRTGASGDASRARRNRGAWRRGRRRREDGDVRRRHRCQPEAVGPGPRRAVRGEGCRPRRCSAYGADRARIVVEVEATASSAAQPQRAAVLALVVLAVLARADRLPPPLVVAVPGDRALEALVEAHLRAPAELVAELLRAQRVAAVVAEAVGRRARSATRRGR